MNEINKQVARARRQLIAGKFFNILTLAVFGGLLLAVIGIAIPKIWHLSFLQTQEQSDAWMYCWILGGVFAGFLVACGLTWRGGVSHLNAAVEIDRRFGLKERLSSAVSLNPVMAETGVGRALIMDAVSSAESIDVRDKFRYRPPWFALMPLVPALILVVLIFIPNAEKKAVAAEAEKIDRQQIAVAVKEFKKKVEEKREQLVAKGLKDAGKDLKALEKRFDKLLDDRNSDKKDTLVQLNDIKKKIEERRKKLGSSNELKQSLNKLKDSGQGPAKQLADALSKGELEEARKAIKELANKLKEGDLNKIEMKKLARDLEQMANELKKIVDKHEAEKRKLQDQIKKALDQGNLDKAAQLQQRLDEKKDLDRQQDKIKKMAENLKKCANCMKSGANGQQKQGKQGDPKQPGQGGEQQAQAMREAGQSLEDLAQQIQEMQQALEELEALEDLEKMADGCKQCMNQGGNEQDEPKWQDWAQGRGIGGGKRGLEKEDTGSFRSRVKGKLQQGETIISGTADGKNLTGRSASEIRELVRSSMSKDSDPLENQKLSRSQREHAQQYFKALRETQ